MDIKNYYLLLELNVNPPEQNPDIIEEAIKKKQAQWSRERNHPTKANLAQQYIGLIPEIRKVMTDPELRKKEALEAQKILIADEKRKFIKIDRHIGILLSKGSISKSEIIKLSQLHSIDADKIRKRVKQRENSFKINLEAERLVNEGKNSEKHIAGTAKALGVDANKFREWVKKKEKDKFLEIDNYIAHCIRRGYITVKEIHQLTHLYEVEENTIFRRVRCPIKKKADPSADKAKPLDKSLEKLINDKLKITGKSSLYDFLDISPASELYDIQKRASEKEAEVRKIGPKDAVATASGTLAGQCLTIFKTEDTRKEYDMSRTLSRIGELNSDIDAAGIDGKISPQSLDIIIKNAIKMGMDIGEAYEYVENYCQNKKWRIIRKKVRSRKKQKLTLLAASVIIILIITLGGFFSIQKIKEARFKAAYENALNKAEKQTELEAKEVILQNFVKYNEQSEYTVLAGNKIKEIHSLIIERDFKKTTDAAEKLYAEARLEDALSVYEKFLAKYPKNKYLIEIKNKMTKISEGIDDREYGALKSLAHSDYDRRVKAYDAYLAKFPQGRHVDEVNQMISQMVDKYFSNFQKELLACEGREIWTECISICDAFIEKFKGMEQTKEAEGFRKKYENRIQNQKDMAEMKIKADKRGTDYEGGRRIYLEYIDANPEMPSYLKKLIISEVAVLDKKIADRDKAQKDWETALEYSKNSKISVSDRIQKMEKFLQQYPGGIHTEEADNILIKLRAEKKIEDERNKEEVEYKEWQKVVAYCQNAQISLPDRIDKIGQYINQNASGKYVKKARLIMAQLEEKKRIEDERLRNYQANLMRLQQEKERVQNYIRSSGRFTDNGNGSVTDRQTGLTWAMLDSFIELNRCVNHQEALDYVKNLSTGGHQDWRVPTINELSGILKNQPAFPAYRGSKWFWTSETYWHGWNKNVYVISQSGSSWEKESVSVGQCGSVLAVR